MNKNNKRQKDRNKRIPKNYMNSKVFMVFDFIWKLFVINVCTIVTSVGIITIVPALVASFRTIKDSYEDGEDKVLKDYFKNFIYCFKDTVWLSVIVIAILSILTYSYMWYSEMITNLANSGTNPGWFSIYAVSMYGLLFIVLIIILAALQFPMVATYLHFHFFDKIKFSFYMAFRYISLTLLELVFLSISAVLSYVLFPAFLIVIGVSGPMFLIYLTSRKYYWNIVNTKAYEYTEDEYDLQGKVHNREVYEDKPEKETEKIDPLEQLNNEIIGAKNDKTRNR